MKRLSTMLEPCLVLSIACTGCLLARMLWPCLEDIPLPLLFIIFTVILVVTIALHIAKWKCWSYLRHDRRRLQSMTGPVSTIKIDRVIAAVLCIWSACYFAISVFIKACHVPWLPATIVFVATGIYTLISASTDSTSSCGSSSSSDESFSVNADSLVAGASSGMSISSSEPERAASSSSSSASNVL